MKFGFDLSKWFRRRRCLKMVDNDGQMPEDAYTLSSGELNQRTNGPVNAHLISGPTVSTKKKKKF